MDQRAGKSLVNLLAKEPDKRLEHVAPRIEVHIPDVLADDISRENLPRVHHEQLQKRELLGSQGDFPSLAQDAVGVPIEFQAKLLEYARPDLRAAPRECAHARQELPPVKGFSQIVVGATVQPPDAVRDVSERRQHQYGSFYAARAEVSKCLQSVLPWEQDIKDDCIVVIRFCEFLPPNSIGGNVDGKTLRAEPTRYRCGNALVIFDQKQSHRRRPQKVNIDGDLVYWRK